MPVMTSHEIKTTDSEPVYAGASTLDGDVIKSDSFLNEESMTQHLLSVESPTSIKSVAETDAGIEQFKVDDNLNVNSKPNYECCDNKIDGAGIAKDCEDIEKARELYHSKLEDEIIENSDGATQSPSISESSLGAHFIPDFHYGVGNAEVVEASQSNHFLDNCTIDSVDCSGQCPSVQPADAITEFVAENTCHQLIRESEAPDANEISSSPREIIHQDRSDDDSASNFSSVTESINNDNVQQLNELASLQEQIDVLSERLLRSHQQVETLLEEKQKWLTNGRQFVPQMRQKTNLTPDTAAIVVKFAQSEQQRMKAEAKIKELQTALSRVDSGGNHSLVADGTVRQAEMTPDGQIEELNLALTEAREKAEHLRHALKQEESRVSDLNAKLTTTREAHRSEQKRAAGQADAIIKLNREIDSLKRHLKEADRIREREAKRLCDELSSRETAEKYNKALAEISTLQERISKLEELEMAKVALENKLEEMQKSLQDLVTANEEAEHCQKREIQLSEFTRRLTERNAGLQADYLAAQSRLAASEKAVGEASRAAEDAGCLAQELAARLQAEKLAAAKSLAEVELKLSAVSRLETSLKADLSKEQEEKATLKRKQIAMDRELARLMTQQRKLTDQLANERLLRQSLSGSNQCLGSASAMASESSQSSPLPPLTHNNSLLGNALLASGGGDSTHLPGDAIEYDKHENGTPDASQISEPSRDLLLNKIDRLQRTNVRLVEKIDFLRDHVGQLTQELQKKSHLIQHYCIREGASDTSVVSLAPSRVDAHKTDLVPRDGDYQNDLQTSLGVNQQALLEDTLYKNVALKENLDTLADEVSRLKRANRELKDLLAPQTQRGLPQTHS